MDIAALVDDPDSRTLRELDQAYGLVKGSAFRVFKRLGGELVEGVHFACCSAADEAVAFAALHAAGRLYASTVTAIVFNAAGSRRMATALAAR